MICIKLVLDISSPTPVAFRVDVPKLVMACTRTETYECVINIRAWQTISGVTDAVVMAVVVSVDRG